MHPVLHAFSHHVSQPHTQREALRKRALHMVLQAQGYCVDVASCHQKGRAQTATFERARALMERAACQGDVIALYNYALMIQQTALSQESHHFVMQAFRLCQNYGMPVEHLRQPKLSWQERTLRQGLTFFMRLGFAFPKKLG